MANEDMKQRLIKGGCGYEWNSFDDIVFNLPPKKSYPVKINIKKVKKSKLRFVNPDKEG